uniref:Uncharacterized protein n=1 Tax=Candidatus Methanogaster sp. ANME-2c ERB4 TaxID=2759911 RepID=A0A7G9YR67_9EURY|nr:hypothetical protein EGLMOMJH_00040 [Methanosarcinales archaeon ANME-2c ERB4]
MHEGSSYVGYHQRNTKREGVGHRMNDIIKETSICRLNDGKTLQHPFSTYVGGVTLTKDHLIIIPIIKTPKYYFIRCSALGGLYVIGGALFISIGVTISLLTLQWILLPFAIVVLLWLCHKLLLSNIRKRMGMLENGDDCLMIPLHSIKKIDMGTRGLTPYKYISVSYTPGKGLCSDISFLIFSKWELILKKNQMAWVCAIKEAMIAAGDGE